MSELKRNTEWDWQQKYIEALKERDAARLAALDELVVLLAMRTPRENTFNDSYRHCLALVMQARDNYQADLEAT